MWSLQGLHRHYPWVRNPIDSQNRRPESLFRLCVGDREIFLRGVARPQEDLSHLLCILVGNRKHRRFDQVPTGPGLGLSCFFTLLSARGWRDAFRRRGGGGWGWVPTGGDPSGSFVFAGLPASMLDPSNGPLALITQVSHTPRHVTAVPPEFGGYPPFTR